VLTSTEVKKMTATDPDLKFAILSLWILGRQYQDANDYWDGNWLNIRAEARASGAVVEVIGPIIHLSELMMFVGQLVALDSSLAGKASLGGSFEPNLSVELVMGSNGGVMGTILITPDHMVQSHKLIFDCDQTYLKPLIAACNKILLDYPIKGTRVVE
jgi:hypothetical protein